MQNQNLKKSIICNAVLAAMELIGISISFTLYGIAQYQYFTENVNLFSFFASVFFCIFGLREYNNGVPMPKLVSLLRNMATINLAVIFCVCLVGAILGYDDLSFGYIMFSDCSLFFHTICPLASVWMAFFAEPSGHITKKETLLPMILPVLYTIIILPLNYLRIVHGPYTFLYVYEVPASTVIIFLFGMLLLSVAFSFGFTYTKNKLID